MTTGLRNGVYGLSCAAQGQFPTHVSVDSPKRSVSGRGRSRQKVYSRTSGFQLGLEDASQGAQFGCSFALESPSIRVRTHRARCSASDHPASDVNFYCTASMRRQCASVSYDLLRRSLRMNTSPVRRQSRSSGTKEHNASCVSSSHQSNPRTDQPVRLLMQCRRQMRSTGVLLTAYVSRGTAECSVTEFERALGTRAGW